MKRKIKIKRKTVLIALSFTAITGASFALILFVFNSIMEREIASSARSAIQALADEYASEEFSSYLEEETETEGRMDEGTEDTEPERDVMASLPMIGAFTEEETEQETEENIPAAGTLSADTDIEEDPGAGAAGTETETEAFPGGLDSEFDSSPYYFALSFLVDREVKPVMVTTPGERSLAGWFSKTRPAEGDIARAAVGGRIYYVSSAPDHYYSSDDSYFWILYVDVTAQQYLIDHIDRIQILIMAACAVIASFFGVWLGISVEREQDRQKEFFENASHELKTPLMSIQGYAEGIYSGVITDTKEASGIIMNETDKMESLVEEILSLSRIESRSVRFAPEWISVAEAVNDCLVGMEYVIRSRSLSVEMNLDGTRVQADPALFERAVANLLSNAVKYARSRIVIGCDKNHLTVFNDGVTLTKEEISHIFDRFYIGPNGSTGIGLALTKEIVLQHGWKIRVQNVSGGVQFVITF